jgi:hypothetical protein
LFLEFEYIVLYEIILNLLAQHQVSDNPIMELSGCWNLSGWWLVSGRAHSAGWGHGFYLFLALLDGKTPMFIDPGETTGWWNLKAATVLSSTCLLFSLSTPHLLWIMHRTWTPYQWSTVSYWNMDTASARDTTRAPGKRKGKRIKLFS